MVIPETENIDRLDRPPFPTVGGFVITMGVRGSSKQSRSNLGPRSTKHADPNIRGEPRRHTRRYVAVHLTTVCMGIWSIHEGDTSVRQVVIRSI
jgi:hypothetical protein